MIRTREWQSLNRVYDFCGTVYFCCKVRVMWHQPLRCILMYLPIRYAKRIGMRIRLVFYYRSIENLWSKYNALSFCTECSVRDCIIYYPSLNLRKLFMNWSISNYYYWYQTSLRYSRLHLLKFYCRSYDKGKDILYWMNWFIFHS